MYGLDNRTSGIKSDAFAQYNRTAPIAYQFDERFEQ